MRFIPARRTILFLSVVWFTLLGCQLTNAFTQAKTVPTNTRAVVSSSVAARPTFTPVPPTQEAPPTLAQPIIPPTDPPPAPRPSPTRAVVVTRPTATKVPVAAPPPPPPPTVDLYQGYYYRVSKNVCVTDTNTRIEGTVTNNGAPQNGVRVRLSSGKYDIPVIDDFVTGTDPNDAKHIAPEWAGKYRLSPAEGQRIDGNWWVFIIDNTGQPKSVAAYIKTHDTAGCNTATVDFAH